MHGQTNEWVEWKNGKTRIKCKTEWKRICRMLKGCIWSEKLIYRGNGLNWSIKIAERVWNWINKCWTKKCMDFCSLFSSHSVYLSLFFFFLSTAKLLYILQKWHGTRNSKKINIYTELKWIHSAQLTVYVKILDIGGDDAAYINIYINVYFM